MNHVNSSGWNCLHLAVYSRPYLVPTLITAGVDVEMQTAQGETALDIYKRREANTSRWFKHKRRLMA